MEKFRKSLKEILHLDPETSANCSNFEVKRSSESTYNIYKAWLKNEPQEVQQAMMANKPFLKRFFNEFDNCFCKHPKPVDPLQGKFFQVDFNDREAPVKINKRKIDEKLQQLKEQKDQKVNEIKEKYDKLKHQQSQCRK